MLNTDIHQFYYQNQNNIINYKVVDNYCVASSVKTDNMINMGSIISMLNSFVDYIKIQHPDIEYLVNFPGTSNPLLLNSMLDVAHNNYYHYKIVYNKSVISINQDFIKQILKPCCKNTTDLHCSTKHNEFKECSIVVNIKNNIDIQENVIVPNFLLGDNK